MGLEIKFEPSISEPTGSRLILSAGGALARSYPMSAEDHYRDLVALRFFLGQRTLSSVLLGDEPVAAIEYANGGDMVTLKPYRRHGERLVTGEFSLNRALSHIDHTLDDLAAIMATDRVTLQGQVTEDISAGVYDMCLRNSDLSD